MCIGWDSLIGNEQVQIFPTGLWRAHWVSKNQTKASILIKISKIDCLVASNRGTIARDRCRRWFSQDKCGIE